MFATTANTHMAKQDKLLRRVLSGTSDTNVSFEQLRGLLTWLGFEERAPGGSHYTYSHPDLTEILTVPRRKPLKPIYVRKTRELILRHRLAGPDAGP